MALSYAIVANPAAGNISLDKKHRILKNAAKIMGARIYGLDTTSRQEFRECIRMLCSKYEVIIAAGGDGTFSDLINSINLSANIAGYLPMGTGNALRYALEYPRSVLLSANRIRYGNIHRLDLIKYSDARYAFMGSVGLEVEVIREYQRLRKKQAQSRLPYVLAGLKAIKEYAKGHLPLSVRIHIDGKEYLIKDAASIIVTKQPYYGYGMKVIPGARFDDGLLHVGIFPPGIINTILMIILSFSIGNVIGVNYIARDAVLMEFSGNRDLHIDGELAGNASRVSFKLMKKALQMVI